jgi:glycosidase
VSLRRLLPAGALLASVAVAAVPAASAPGQSPPTGAELAELAQPPVRTSIASQRIYFLMTDRYANGDRANDTGGLAGPRGATGYDPADPAYFHGGDLKGLTGDCTNTRTGLARLKRLGFTAIWVTPPFVQKAVQGDSAAYHGYWALDLTSVDPHLGTEADFAAFVDCAHRLGLKVILDVLVNHTADVIQLSSTSFSPPPQPPHVASVPPAEREAKRPSWLNDPANYHNRGNIGGASCSQECLELGDFFGLDDLLTEQPAVMAGLADVYAEWIRRYRIDGFRIDTARHVNPEFFGLWVPRILEAARAAGVPDFEIFGEAFVRDSVALSTFVRERGLPNVLDFPLQDPAVRFAAGRGNGAAIAGRLADDDYFALPSGVVHTPPTFLGNHDIGRAALNLLAVGPAAGSILRRVLLGYDLLYLLRGAPVVYYGDEVGIIGSGIDRAARQDMFSTQVAEWRTDPRVGSPPIGTRSSFDVVNHPISNRLRALAALRDAHRVLATGATHVRASSRRVLAVSRVGLAERREYVAVFNSGTRPARLTLRTATPSSTWLRLLGRGRMLRSRSDGSLTITVPAVSTLLLRAARTLPARPVRAPRLTVARDGLSGLVRVSAGPASGPVSVTFAVRRAGASWERIAADDSPPYRAFVASGAYPAGSEVVAVVRALDGSTAVSAVTPLVPGRLTHG